MNETSKSPGVEDLASVGCRVSWSAILGGAFIAMGIYFLLATLGTAVGLSTATNARASTTHAVVLIWAVVTAVSAFFVGGMVTSLLTAGETKTEAVVSGVIMWALIVSFLMVLGTAGLGAGLVAMQQQSLVGESPSSWEEAARAAGVPAERIEDWRSTQKQDQKQDSVEVNVAAASTRMAWYVFAGTWLSMIAAAVGALLGAGPTFRVVPVAVTRPLVGVH